MPEATWKPHEKHGLLTMQSDLPDSVYAFPNQRKEPLTDAEHVRNAVARFDQVIDVSDADRALAFANIEKAANYYDVNLAETSWHDLGVHPQKNRKKAASKGAVTRKRRVDAVSEGVVAPAISSGFYLQCEIWDVLKWAKCRTSAKTSLC